MNSTPVDQAETDKRGDVRRWFCDPLGRRLLEEERRYLEEALPYLFGYHLVQVGRLAEADLIGSSRVLHRVVMDQDYASTAIAPSFYGYPDQMPIESCSIDVLLLHHSLEFETEPHQVLREADRVLIPEGHVVIICFNPWSLWGLWRLVLKRRGRAPWSGQFLSHARLKDWLALLGFDLTMSKPYFFRPPLRNERIMQKLQFLDRLGARWWPLFAGAQLIIAKKRVATLTPLKPRWRSRHDRVTAPGVIRPAPN